MATPIWGLQALVASKTTPIDNDTFCIAIGDELLDGSVPDLAGIDEVDAIVSIAIACYRFANKLNISLDDKIRDRLKR